MSDEVLQASVSVPPDVLIQELPDDERVLLNVATEEYFGLDRMGSDMWRALTEADTVEAACHDLSARYDVDPERLRHDVGVFVEQLRERGLVELHAR